MLLITTIMVYLLLTISIFIVGYVIHLKFKFPLLPIQFSWLAISQIFCGVCYILLMIYDYNQFIKIEYFKYIVIYLFLASYLYFGLYLSKFHEMFKNIILKKAYLFLNISSIFMLFYAVVYKLVLIPHSNENTIFLLLLGRHENVFFILVVIPILIMFLSNILLTNKSGLKLSIKILNFIYLFQYLKFVVFFVALDHQWMLVFFMMTKLIFYYFLIKNLIIDKGRHQCQ